MAAKALGNAHELSQEYTGPLAGLAEAALGSPDVSYEDQIAGSLLLSASLESKSFGLGGSISPIRSSREKKRRGSSPFNAISVPSTPDKEHKKDTTSWECALTILDVILFSEDSARALQPSHKLVRCLVKLLGEMSYQMIALSTLQQFPMSSFLRECIANASSTIAAIMSSAQMDARGRLATVQIVQIILLSPTPEAKMLADRSSEVRRAYQMLTSFQSSTQLLELMVLGITRCQNLSQVVAPGEAVTIVHSIKDSRTVAELRPSLTALNYMGMMPKEGGGGWNAIAEDCESQGVAVFQIVIDSFNLAVSNADCERTASTAIASLCRESTSVSVDPALILSAVQRASLSEGRITLLDVLAQKVVEDPRIITLSALQSLTRIATESLNPDKVAVLSSVFQIAEKCEAANVVDSEMLRPIVLSLPIVGAQPLPLLRCVRTLCNRDTADSAVKTYLKKKGFATAIALHASSNALPESALALMAYLLAVLQENAEVVLAGNVVVLSMIETALAADTLEASEMQVVKELHERLTEPEKRREEEEKKRATETSKLKDHVHVLLSQLERARKEAKEKEDELAKSNVVLQSQLQSLADTQEQLRAAKEQLEQENNELKIEISCVPTLQRQVSTLQDQLAKSEMELQKSMSAFHGASSALLPDGNAGQYGGSAGQELLVADEKTNMQAAHEAELQSQLDEAKTSVETLREKLESSDLELRKMEDMYTALKDQHASVEKEIESLKSQATTADTAETAELRRSLDKADADMKELNRQLLTKTEALDAQLSANRLLQEEVKAMEAKSKQSDSQRQIQTTIDLAASEEKGRRHNIKWMESVRRLEIVETFNRHYQELMDFVTNERFDRSTILEKEGSLRQQMASMSIVDLQQIIAEQGRSIAKAFNAEKEAHHRLKTAEISNEEARRAIQDLNTKLSAARAEVEKIRTDGHKLLEEQLSASRHQTALAREEQIVIRQELLDARAAAESKQRELQASIDALQKEKTAMALRIDQLSNERNSVHVDLQTKTSDVDDLKLQLHRSKLAKEETEHKHKEQVMMLKNEVENLNNQFSLRRSEHQKMVESLREQHKTALEREAKHLKDSMVARHEQEVKSLKSAMEYEVTRHGTLIAERNAHIKKLEEELEKRPTPSVVTDLRIQLEEYIEKLETSQRSQTALAQVNADLDTEVIVLRDKLKASVQSQSAADSTLAKMKDDVSAAKKRADALQTQVNALQARLDDSVVQTLMADEKRRFAELEARRLSAADEFMRLAQASRSRPGTALSRLSQSTEAHAGYIEDYPPAAVSASRAVDDSESESSTHHRDTNRRALGGMSEGEETDALRALPSSLPFRMLPSRDAKDRYILQLLAALNRMRSAAKSKEGGYKLKHESASSWERDRSSVMEGFRHALAAQQERYESELDVQRVKIDELREQLQRVFRLAEASGIEPAVFAHAANAPAAATVASEVAPKKAEGCPCLCHRDTPHTRIRFRCNCQCNTGSGDSGSMTPRTKHVKTPSPPPALRRATAPVPPEQAGASKHFDVAALDLVSADAHERGALDFRVPGGPPEPLFYDRASDPHLRKFLARKMTKHPQPQTRGRSADSRRPNRPRSASTNRSTGLKLD